MYMYDSCVRAVDQQTLTADCLADCARFVGSQQTAHEQCHLLNSATQHTIPVYEKGDSFEQRYKLMNPNARGCVDALGVRTPFTLIVSSRNVFVSLNSP